MSRLLAITLLSASLLLCLQPQAQAGKGIMWITEAFESGVARPETFSSEVLAWLLTMLGL